MACETSLAKFQSSAGVSLPVIGCASASSVSPKVFQSAPLSPSTHVCATFRISAAATMSSLRRLTCGSTSPSVGCLSANTIVSSSFCGGMAALTASNCCCIRYQPILPSSPSFFLKLTPLRPSRLATVGISEQHLRFWNVGFSTKLSSALTAW